MIEGAAPRMMPAGSGGMPRMTGVPPVTGMKRPPDRRRKRAEPLAVALPVDQCGPMCDLLREAGALRAAADALAAPAAGNLAVPVFFAIRGARYADD